ncbi:MAG: PIN domain-containing protein [Solirubrobacterales bacterium]|nr:PIN domain-containing protein [Solirubrobacterales bacterium]
MPDRRRLGRRARARPGRGERGRRRSVVELTTLIDTSVLIRARPLASTELAGNWALSAVSVGELEAGVLLAAGPEVRAARARRLTAITTAAPVLGIDAAVASRYAELRAATGRLATNDLWIAATALANDLTLLTGDRRQAALPLVRTAVAD